jgi:hypothetical protein
MPRKADSTPQNPRGKVRDPFEDFERVGGKDGRPRIPPPGKSGRDALSPKIKADAYSRASSIGETLESQFGLGQWRMRQVAFGIGRRKDLYIAASALRGNDGPNKAILEDIADKAMEAAESSAGATIGTAIHALREQHDEGANLDHVSGEVREALDKWVELTAGFRVLASEAKTVCDVHKVAGTFDVLLELLGPMVTPDGTVLPAGTIVIGDLKTSGTSDYFGCKFAIQLAEYAHGVPFDVERYGRITWDELGGTPHQRWALVIHIPTGNPEGSGLHWVDVESGRELTDLAITVRRQRSRKDLVVPAKPPVLPAAMDAAGLLAAIMGVHGTADEAKVAFNGLWREHKSIWSPVHKRAADARLDQIAQLASVGG